MEHCNIAKFGFCIQETNLIQVSTYNTEQSHRPPGNVGYSVHSLARSKEGVDLDLDLAGNED